MRTSQTNNVLSWEDSITRIIESKDRPPQKYFYWSMPRQIGVTSFLCKLANEKSNYNKVLFIVKDHNSIAAYSRELDSMQQKFNYKFVTNFDEDYPILRETSHQIKTPPINPVTFVTFENIKRSSEGRGFFDYVFLDNPGVIRDIGFQTIARLITCTTKQIIHIDTTEG